MTNNKTNTLKTIDLFAGTGGIRLGFEQAFNNNLETVFVSEFDSHAAKTYAANFNTPASPCKSKELMTDAAPYIYGDITKINKEDVPEFDICLAGFPCQAFSMAGKRHGFNDNYKGRTRGTLFQDVIRICDHHKPKVIFCENVKGLTTHDKGNTFEVIKGAFEEIGYTVFYQVLNSKNFGVPQSRERIYLVVFRNDIAPESFEFPVSNGKDNSKVKLKNILEDAPIPSRYYLSKQYLSALRAHRARHEAKGHGFGYVIRSLDGISGTITSSASGREGNLIIDTREHSMVPTTNIKGEINNEDIRALTPREFARLQGFPDDFKLPCSPTQTYKQMGNAVTIPVIRAIAEKIREVLEKL